MNDTKFKELSEYHQRVMQEMRENREKEKEIFNDIMEDNRIIRRWVSVMVISSMLVALTMLVGVVVVVLT